MTKNFGEKLSRENEVPESTWVGQIPIVQEVLPSSGEEIKVKIAEQPPATVKQEKGRGIYEFSKDKRDKIFRDLAAADAPRALREVKENIIRNKTEKLKALGDQIASQSRGWGKIKGILGFKDDILNTLKSDADMLARELVVLKSDLEKLKDESEL